ncbi:hypothetical protein [Streptomyces sp. NPDC020141]|uniref:hypothetical protein n=1 Tax=Streptomyces sp. NPDC020141 TaxID=3365065 RepID=UPI00379027A9
MPTRSPRRPRTPVISAFHLHTVQADALETAAGVLGAEARIPALLVAVATRIVTPVTAFPDPDTDTACEGTFALGALGRVFLNILRADLQPFQERYDQAAAQGDTARLTWICPGKHSRWERSASWTAAARSRRSNRAGAATTRVGRSRR